VLTSNVAQILISLVITYGLMVREELSLAHGHSQDAATRRESAGRVSHSRGCQGCCDQPVELPTDHGVAFPEILLQGRPSSPQDVARAVARAIERNRAETTVATGSMRLSAALGGVAPVLVGDLARLLGAGSVRAAMVAARNRGDNGQPDR
jgi:hypothetical protein